MPYHAEVIHPDGINEYCGIVDKAHVSVVLSLVGTPGGIRLYRAHPRDISQFYILRDDGLLDHYVAVEGES
jgi:hypothetical protein